MPYAKRRYKKTKRSNYSRLADKKINTLVEKRMEEIAKKEINKGKRYYVEARSNPTNLAYSQYTGTGIGANFLYTNLAPHNTSGITTSLKSVDYFPLTDFGNNYILNQQPDDAVEAQIAQSIDFQIKQAQAFVSLRNNLSVPVKVCCALIAIPNANKYTASADNGTADITTALRPNRAMLTKNNWKFASTDSGIFAGHYATATDYATCKYQILDRKTVTLPAGLNKTSGGSPSTSAIYKNVDVKLSKIWKTPKKVHFNPDASTIDNRSVLMNNYNIYFAITTDYGTTNNTTIDIKSQVIAGLKFSLGNSARPKNKATSYL